MDYEMEQYLNSPLNVRLMAPIEFQYALRKGCLEIFFRRMLGLPRHLIPFIPVKKKLNLVTRMETGPQEIRLDKIIGSVDKYEFFSHSLMPLSTRLEKRWSAIYILVQGARRCPPIEVYKVRKAYFILDGHHRASVARYLGNEVIEAYVTEWLVSPN